MSKILLKKIYIFENYYIIILDFFKLEIKLKNKTIHLVL